MNNINSIRVRKNDIKVSEIRSDNKEIEVRDDITEEIPLTTSIINIGLTKKTSNLLQRVGINNLERLLKLDYKDLRNVRGLGTMGKNEILICLHRLGYEMSGENLALEYQSLVRKNKGEELLADLGLQGMTCKALNRAGIYTMEDLIKNLNNLDKIPNFGTVKKHIVEVWLEDLKSEEADLITPQQDSNQEVLNLQTRNNEIQQENDAIKKRIVKKRKLLEEYQRITEEREQLLQQEQDLDRQLDQLRREQHATGPKLTKTTKQGK